MIEKQQIRQKLSLLENTLNRSMGCSMALKKLSPWLSEFQWHYGENEVELPTQFIDEHQFNKTPKIVKFGQQIEVFYSLRKPIKLKIICSNGKSYDFLVKYGEDLRQDQRIQHIFYLMNEQLTNDRMCVQRNLLINTYSVIPISSLCGLISFVEDSVPIAQLFPNVSTDARNSFDKFIANATNNKNVSMDVAYGEAALKYTPLEVSEILFS